MCELYIYVTHVYVSCVDMWLIFPLLCLVGGTVPLDFHLVQLAVLDGDFKTATEYLSLLIESRGSLSISERDVFSTAYRGLIQERLDAWKEAQGFAQLAIEAEIWQICSSLVTLLNRLISAGDENCVFYLKMKGDYSRYLAQVSSESRNRDMAVLVAQAAYAEASQRARTTLRPADPLRLGLAYNYSVLMHTLAGNPRMAREIVETALAQGRATVTSPESRLVLGLLTGKLDEITNST